MSSRAVEHVFIGTTTSYDLYDSTKTTLGPAIYQASGVTSLDNYAGPFGLAVARPAEDFSASFYCPSAISVGSNNWVFSIENTASTNKLIALYKFNTLTAVWTKIGKITITLPSGTHTVRGMQVQRYLHTTGTVAVTGTAVTGTTTDFSTSRMAAGARIGFGSTDPTAITTWYYISSINSDTSITLSGSATTFSAGTAYVVEELRPYLVTTNTTPTNGGLFVAKGVNYDDFTSGGTTISSAISTDNVKAVYWLADASTVTNTIASGLCFSTDAVISPTSNSNQNIYVLNLNTSTTCKLFKYNVRASLTVSSGKSTDALVLSSGIQALGTTLPTTNTIVSCTTSHGPGSGIPCLYFLGSANTVLRVKEIDVAKLKTKFTSDIMTCNPIGSVYTNLSPSFNSLFYSTLLDKFFIFSSNGSKSMVIEYLSDAADPQKAFSCNSGNQDIAIPGTGLVPVLSTADLPMHGACAGSFCYITREIITSSFLYTAYNQLYAVPLLADWNYTKITHSVLITPEMNTPNCSSFSKVYTNFSQFLGGDALGYQTEDHKVYCRTSGIIDNTGEWLELDNSGIINASPANSIQFMIEFNTIGVFCIPTRIYSLTVLYNDFIINSHYQPSALNSSGSAKIFSWKFSSSYGGTVPTLTVYIYNALTGSLLLSDNTSGAFGLWEKSTNGGSSWSSYNTSDKSNDTTYIRYTPYLLADSIKARVLLV